MNQPNELIQKLLEDDLNTLSMSVQPKLIRNQLKDKRLEFILAIIKGANASLEERLNKHPALPPDQRIIVDIRIQQYTLGAR